MRRWHVVFLSLLALSAAQGRELRYKVSSTLFDKEAGGAIPTPGPILDKIRKAFALWGSVADSGLTFVDGGTFDAATEKAKEKGTVYIHLEGRDAGGDGVAGAGGFEGTIPDGYRKGSIVFNTRRGLYVLKMKTIVHELGHALGLAHNPSTAAAMHCGTPAWGDHDFYALGEQDRAALVARWNPGAAGLYSLSGKVSLGAKPAAFATVVAVNAVNGHAYSAQADGEGRFAIAILRAGGYRLFAKALEFNTPVSWSPSWYVANGKSDNDPGRGKVLELGPGHRSHAGLSVRAIRRKPPLILAQSMSADPTTFSPAFLVPGAEGELTLLFSNGRIASVAAYGSHPDYGFSALKDAGRGGYSVTVKAEPGAEEGERLVVARGPSGTVQAGLVGVQIVKKVPALIPGSLADESAMIAAQAKGGFPFATLNPDYWK